ncbi:hypothetical protein [Clostridium tepidum]|nr:hypothetical protein [Clostridium tepidum]
MEIEKALLLSLKKQGLITFTEYEKALEELRKEELKVKKIA